MRSRFPLFFWPRRLLAPKRRGIWSRLMGACVLCGVGAVGALELYPQMFSAASSDYGLSVEQSRFADRSSDRWVLISLQLPNPIVALPLPRELATAIRLVPSLKLRCSSCFIGLQPRFAAADDGQAVPPIGRPRPRRPFHPIKQTRAKTKYAHNSHHGTAKSRDRQYRQPPSTWVAGNGVWGAFDYAGRGWR